MSKFLENLSGKSAVTVGFELEFLVAWKADNDAATTDSRVVKVPTNHTLGGEQVIRTYIHNQVKDKLEKPGWPQVTVHEVPDGTPNDLYKTHWVVKPDVSLKGTSGPGPVQYMDVEICTSIFKLKNGDEHKAKCWSLMTAAMERLNKQLLIHVNQTCAFQVHVGMDYDLLTVKKLATILWLAEDRLVLLYNSYRQQSNQQYRRLREASMLATAQKNGPVGNSYSTGSDDSDLKKWLGSSISAAQDPGDRLKYLWTAETESQLVTMLRGNMSIKDNGVRLAYNFTEVFQHRKTVEFRQMEGTMDSALVENWGIVCSRLVLFSSAVKSDKFQGLVRSLVGSSNISTLDFLRAIGCGSSVVGFFKDKIKRN